MGQVAPLLVRVVKDVWQVWLLVRVVWKLWQRRFHRWAPSANEAVQAVAVHVRLHVGGCHVSRLHGHLLLARPVQLT